MWINSHLKQGQPRAPQAKFCPPLTNAVPDSAPPFLQCCSSALSSPSHLLFLSVHLFLSQSREWIEKEGQCKHNRVRPTNQLPIVTTSLGLMVWPPLRHTLSAQSNGRIRPVQMQLGQCMQAGCHRKPWAVSAACQWTPDTSLVGYSRGRTTSATSLLYHCTGS